MAKTSEPSRYRFQFPERTRPPALLEALVRFVEPLDDFFSGGFELTDDLSGWFDDNPEAARQLVVFGQDGDGSLYALWMYPGRSADDAPVVYLNSEGDGNRLVADNLLDFLTLLALDVDELGFWVADEPWAAEAIAYKKDRSAGERDSYRSWLHEQYGRSVPDADTADGMTRAGQERHPAFDEWVEQQLGGPDSAPAESPDRSPDESATLVIESAASRAAFDAGMAEFLREVARQRPDLVATSSSSLRGVIGKRQERFHETFELPADLTNVSELRVVYEQDDSQVLCVVINPRPDHFEALLWMKPHPELSPEHLRVRAAFDQHVGGAGKILVRRGNGA